MHGSHSWVEENFLKFQNYLRTFHFEIYLFCSRKFNQILGLTSTARANEFVTLRG